nr:immunoglobulin light chain junction region [Macaca mulatta]MOX18488.1 immunoglobulin light chain junction region [Macaca mulatta]MOX18730.1 immunoglobulin light chain junction region [Macaca mulatta]MOX19170.1 immunoglobulin light chain junction region [Macaca mulatta]MOX19619.1 immunoglobulin light chain junction region [Macaca mulatta]
DYYCQSYDSGLSAVF